MDQNNASPKKMNVGLIGAGFMAKAHSIAYAGMPMFFLAGTNHSGQKDDR